MYSAAEVDILYADGRKNFGEVMKEVRAIFRAKYMETSGKMNKEQTASLQVSIGEEQTISSQAERSVAVTPDAAHLLT